MRSVLVLASAIALAQSSHAAISTFVRGYGRFACTIVNGDGTFSPDPTQCLDANLVNPGTDTDGTGNQGDGVTPTNPVCTLQIETGAYYCGIAGAACSSDANCDNGHCVGGTCQGGFTQACAGDDANCIGFLYCLDGSFSPTASNTCGGDGSFCQDYTQGNPANTDAENYAIFNQFCASGYCNYGTGNCDQHVTTVGGDCSSDPLFACTQTSTGQALTCDQTSFTCQLAVVPSGRARTRRNLERRNLCPAGHSACEVEGTLGYECIDTASSLEMCGGCPGVGVDCTALPGVEGVGCVMGECEIWSCMDGFQWSAETQTCAPTA
ncbi:hypothetical protein JCM10212_006428 [Sporobolomyces blumeae]